MTELAEIIMATGPITASDIGWIGGRRANSLHQSQAEEAAGSTQVNQRI
ncbi:hypothetical protein [Bradyrhizobium elkanii]|nr:hypothetical protein [Bradyrhizobium elkanii]